MSASSHNSHHYTPAILLAGLTGAGKSTFISQLTSSTVAIGHDLESCTTEIASFDADIAGTPVRLIDTPGLDDSERSDSEILGAVAVALTMLYRAGVPLAGVIYLHRISDTRVGGASRKSIRILEAICGPEAYSGIAVVTTMWDKLSNPSEGARREQQLVTNPEFFGPFFSGNTRAISKRHDGSRASAEAIVQEVLQRSSHQPVVLQLQRQLVDDKLALEDTAAGVVVDAGLRQQQQRLQEELEELEQALAETRDEVTRAQLREEQQSQAQRLQSLSASRTVLSGTWQQLVNRTLPQEIQRTAHQQTVAQQNTGSAHLDEIVALQETVRLLEQQIQSARDGQTEQEIQLLQARSEQRTQRFKSMEDQLKVQDLHNKLETARAQLQKQTQWTQYNPHHAGAQSHGYDNSRTCDYTDEGSMRRVKVMVGSFVQGVASLCSLSRSRRRHDYDIDDSFH